MKEKKLNESRAPRVEYVFDTPEAIREFMHRPYIERLMVIMTGISKRQLMDFRNISEVDVNKLSKVIGIHERSIYIKREDGVFSKYISDAIIAVIDVYSFGYNHFKEHTMFNKWMTSLNPNFRFSEPLDHCGNFIGVEEVKKEILRLKSEAGELI